MSDIKAAAAFLAALDPNATFWTFQTFDDVASRKDHSLAAIRHGSLEQHFAELAELNARGAGVFFMPNRGDGKGRKTDNVTGVRALFIDLDGASLDAVRICSVDPHLIVQTSFYKWHVYWRVTDCPLERFEPLQHALAQHFRSDPAVCDLPRVMRLPGFDHRKNPEQPYAVQVVDAYPLPIYRVADIVSNLRFTIAQAGTRAPIVGVDTADVLTAGARHGALLSYAGRLRELGTNRDEIFDALAAVNKRRCQPPKSEDELREIAAYVGEKSAGDDRLRVVARQMPEIESAAPILVFGPPASLKSWLALAICDAIVRGEPFLELQTRQRPSARYLNLDAGAVTFRNRMRAISDAPGFDFVSLSAAEYSHDLLRSVLPLYRGGSSSSTACRRSTIPTRRATPRSRCARSLTAYARSTPRSSATASSSTTRIAQKSAASLATITARSRKKPRSAPCGRPRLMSPKTMARPAGPRSSAASSPKALRSAPSTSTSSSARA